MNLAHFPRIKFAHWLKPEYANDLAFARDGDQYVAELITLPDFGCVQHEDAD